MQVTSRVSKPTCLLLNNYHTSSIDIAVQVLLSLPTFIADLKQGRQQLEAAGQPLSQAGVYSALLDCVAAKVSVSGWAGCRRMTLCLLASPRALPPAGPPHPHPLPI